MRKTPAWLRRLGVGGISALTAGGASLVALAPPASATANFSLSRLSGVNRYATAQAISTFTFANGVNTVLLASGLNFPDALAGSYLAGNENSGTGAPILLTDPNTLSPEAAAAISTLKATNVIILGGSAAVSDAVASTLSSTKSSNAAGGNLTVTRVAGPTRYDTDQAVNSQSSANTVGTDSTGAKTAVLATGNNFPDALAAGALSYAKHLPLLLTDGNQTTVTPQAINVINADGIKHVIIVGGSGAVNPAQNAELTTKGITVTQDAGPDRSATSVAIAEDELSNFKFVNTHFNVANGFDPSFVGVGALPSGFSSDALAGSPHSGQETAPTLITLSPDNAGSACTFATNHAATEANGHIFGGNAAITDATAEALERCAGNANPPVPGNASTGPVAVTTLPQLTSAKILGTVTANNSNANTPAGTTVQYTFSKPVASANAGDFKLYPSNGTAPATGTSATISSNGTVVDVLFGTVDTTTGTGVTNVNNDTLATVASGAVTTTMGTTNPDGSAPVGTTSSTMVTPGKTSAPNLVSVSGFRLGNAANTTEVDFTFDKAATVTNPNGFQLVQVNDTLVTCTGPAVGSSNASGGTVSGGNGTTVITVTCPDVNAGTSSALSTSNVARGDVQANTVKDSTGAFNNPLQAVTVSNGGLTTGPDLQSATFEPAGSSSNSGSNDQVLYQFDQPVTGTTAINPMDFGVFKMDGTQTTGTAAATSSSNSNAVLVTFPAGSLTNAVGANVNTGANGATGNTNAIQPDSVGVANSNTTSQTAGTIDAPQLSGVALSSGTNSFGQATESASYTFTQPVTTTAADAGSFHLYQSNGTELTATSCSVSSSSGSVVVCSGYNFGTGTGTSAGTASDVSSAVLGTVDAGDVTGNSTTSGHTNPEGAANTTGGTGTPAAP